MRTLRFAVLLALTVLSGTVNAAALDAAALRSRTIAHYQDTKTFRAHGRALVASNVNGKLEIMFLEEVEIAFDRAKGIRATSTVTFRNGAQTKVVAWGPLNAIQSYRESRDDGFISMVENRSPAEEGGNFSNLAPVEHALNPGRVLTDLLLQGRFNEGDQGKWTAEKTASGAALIHTIGYIVDRREKRYVVASDGHILGVVGRSDIHMTHLRTAALFAQEFGVPIPSATLRYVPPEHGSVFDRNGALKPEQLSARLPELAAAGNRDAKMAMLLSGTLDPASKTPKHVQFQQVEAQLREAEKLGFVAAYALRAQLFQPDNRIWFPADLAKLSDVEIRRRQRAILLEGARQCSPESFQALDSNRVRPVTAAEKTLLVSYVDACNKKRTPDEIKALQARLDAGESLVEVLK